MAIYCQHCGTQNESLATICTQCGSPLRTAGTPAAAPAVPPPEAPGAPPTKVENYLIPAILVTVCCCVPLGIPAIVYAAQVNSKVQSGDLLGAQASSRNAKTWCIVAFVAGAAGGLLYGLLALFGALSER